METPLQAQLLFGFIVCECPQECDCEQPEPVAGVALISNHCPEHNWNPYPDPHCMIHVEQE